MESHTSSMLTDGVILKSGEIVLSGMAGTLIVSKDHGHTFSSLDLGQRNNFTSLVEMKPALIILTSEAGVEVKDLGDYLSE